MKALALAAALMIGGPAAAAAEPVEVMVVGTWHFDNPGLDLNNVNADDVLTPRRQTEIEAVAAALAAFRPTRIMVERVAPDLIDPHYARFAPAALRQQRDERVQIGYRISHRLGLETVHAIDEQSGPGEPDYFPFGTVADYARANGMQPRIDALMAKGAAITRNVEEKQATHSIAELLIDQNDPEGAASGIDPYYELLAVGEADQQPGADLNAMWYLRNAKIFAKLMTVAEPGDRILVIYGSGHNYWLRHFAGETPGYRNIDPVPYLERRRLRSEAEAHAASFSSSRPQISTSARVSSIIIASSCAGPGVKRSRSVPRGTVG